MEFELLKQPVIGCHRGQGSKGSGRFEDYQLFESEGVVLRRLARICAGKVIGVVLSIIGSALVETIGWRFRFCACNAKPTAAIDTTIPQPSALTLP